MMALASFWRKNVHQNRTELPAKRAFIRHHHLAIIRQIVTAVFWPIITRQLPPVLPSNQYRPLWLFPLNSASNLAEPVLLFTLVCYSVCIDFISPSNSVDCLKNQLVFPSSSFQSNLGRFQRWKSFVTWFTVT